MNLTIPDAGWGGYSAEEMLDPTFFDFYHEKLLYLDAKPNAAHLALAALELHGLRRAVRCGVRFVKNNMGIPACGHCGGCARPSIVLYEEHLDEEILKKAVKAITAADVLIVGGTSLAVCPAAGFADCFRGGHLVIVNRSETGQDDEAQLILNDDIGKVFAALEL